MKNSGQLRMDQSPSFQPNKFELKFNKVTNFLEKIKAKNIRKKEEIAITGSSIWILFHFSKGVVKRLLNLELRKRFSRRCSSISMFRHLCMFTIDVLIGNFCSSGMIFWVEEDVMT
ncbi:hypothetical protein BpHYR1_018081 [Brachionus plicatilis]|uniref:Uncharacterized protein n=1 Tax=Brachionus plicatilis TaxID=10195 RepID=A0A3M7T1J3_BRAPC|nr:hypothetical protein BpHYR1_018081 [Brachionus plicatilis]